MTPFQKNITKSIDNLQVLERDLNLVYGEDLPKNIDKMLEDNIDSKSGNDLTFNNTVKNGKLDIVPLGLCTQDTNIITYTCSGLETGVYDFTYNEVTYYFTMPTIARGDVIYFNTDTLKLYKGDTEIVTSSTGEESTTIIFVSTPNPYYPQDIRVVTGDNSVVVQNKNLLKLATDEITVGDVNIKILNNGTKIILNGTATQSTTTGYSFNSYIDKRLIGQKVSYSVKCSDENIQYKYWLGYFTASGSATNTFNGWNTNDRTGSFKVEDKILNATAVKYRPVIGVVNGVTYNNVELDIQIELGSTATKYVQHKEQTCPIHLGSQYLAGIDTYKDKIIGYTNHWKIVRNIGKADLSTLTWRTYGGNPNNFARFTNNDLTNIKYVSDNTELGVGLAEKYRNHTGSGMGSVSDYYFCIDVDKIQITDKNTSSPTGLFYYALATPVEIDITDTTLISDLNKIYNDAITYEGQTNISVESDLSNAQMSIDVNLFVTEKEV